MDKDQKLIAGLIPIILILSLTLYLFPESSGLTATIQAPLMNQTNHSVTTKVSNNSSTVGTQSQSANTQTSQSTSSSSNYYPSSTNTNTNTNTGNSSSNPTPSNPTDTGNGTTY